MPDPARPHLLLAGVTTRPLALSAVRNGYRVTAIDAFGDLDLRAVAQVIVPSPQRPDRTYGPMEAAAAAAKIRADLAGYTSNFENYPAAVARLAAGRQLLGNAPAVLTRVRNPIQISRFLRQHGFTSLECRTTSPDPGSGPWLLKPRRSGGGHGIVPWRGDGPVPRTMYLQRRIAGAPGSISFAADGTNAVILGFSRQLIGERRFGASRFRYCGSVLGTPGLRLFRRQDELLVAASRVAVALTREFGLRGLNGIDFIARGGVPYPVEVNPRYSASMELIELRDGASMFEIHARSSAGEQVAPPRAGSVLQGKAIVFAREDCRVGESRSWLVRGWLADVPPPGTRIRQGRPICTVFASGGTALSCKRLLARRAATIYRSVKSLRRQAA